MAALSGVWPLEQVIDSHSTQRGSIMTRSHRWEPVVCGYGQRSRADLQKHPAKLDCPANGR